MSQTQGNGQFAEQQQFLPEVTAPAGAQYQQRGPITAKPGKRKKKFGKIPLGSPHANSVNRSSTVRGLTAGSFATGATTQATQNFHHQPSALTAAQQAFIGNNKDLSSQGQVPATPDLSHLAIPGLTNIPSKNQINIVAKKRPPAMPLKNHENNIDPKRKVLYRNFHDISGTIFLVEISRNALKVFILLFPNFEAPDIYLHETIAEKKAQKLMTESDNMFEELVKKFHVKYGRL